MTRKADPQNAPLAVIAGAGPGLGAALKRRFQAGGYRAVGLSRTAQPGGPDEDVLECDLTDAQAVAATMAHLIGAYGPPKVVVHNPAKLTIPPFESADLADFEAAWRVMTLSAALLPWLKAGSARNYHVDALSLAARRGERGQHIGAPLAGFAHALKQALHRHVSLRAVAPDHGTAFGKVGRRKTHAKTEHAAGL